MRKEHEIPEYSRLATVFYRLVLLFYKNTFVIDYFMKKIDCSKKVLEIGSGTGKEFQIIDYVEYTESKNYDSFIIILQK
jgi:hypothetical protein